MRWLLLLIMGCSGPFVDGDDCRQVVALTNAYLARCNRPERLPASKCEHMIVDADAAACRAFLEAAACDIMETPEPCRIGRFDIW